MPPALRGYMPSATAGNSAAFPSPPRIDLDGHSARDQGQMSKSASNNYFENISSEDVDSFFDFADRSRTASPGKQGMAPTAPFGTGNGWENFQSLSPPNSAVYPAGNWRPFDYGGQQMPHNILTQIDPSRARAQYGQTTPPDDDNSNNLEGQLNHHLNGLASSQSPSTGNGKKRKQSGLDNDEPPSAPKRTRKNQARSAKGKELDLDNPDDQRRSRFLERNRVAASKCRQKKKEWTQNLEHRARDLQRENHSLRLLLDSCKEEILFLKGEMLKHTGCGCENIQESLQRGVDPFVGQTMKQEPVSPANLTLPSPGGGSNQAHQDAIDKVVGDPPNKRTVEESLEALLRPQYAHDTSEEGIAAQVQQ